MKETEQYHIEGRRASEITVSIEAGVRDGVLRPGEQLPPVRRLAADLGVSPVTVAAAYRALRLRGLVATHGRRGTMVSLGPSLPTRGPLRVPAGVRNLADGNPDPSLLPSLRKALERVEPVPRLYGDQPHLATLLKLARQRLAEDGVPAEAVTIVGGAMDAFERVLSAHLQRGDRIAVEDPGHANLLDLLGALGLEAEPVRVDDDGPIPDDLERALKRGSEAFVVTPRAHNPTGAVLGRQRLAELARVLKHFPDRLVIEDDHSSGVAGAPARTLVGERLSRWAVVRSVSKSLGPDLRLAVVAGDATTISRVEGRRLLGAGWVSGVLQMLVVALWSDPEVQQLVETAATAYTERRTALLSALARRGIRAHGRSGLNVWVPVNEERTSVARLLEAGWAVSPGERFRVASQPALRVTITTLQLEEVERFAADFAVALQPSSDVYGA